LSVLAVPDEDRDVPPQNRVAARDPRQARGRSYSKAQRNEDVRALVGHDIRLATTRESDLHKPDASPRHTACNRSQIDSH
jgi:hypothetical protein